MIVKKIVKEPKINFVYFVSYSHTRGFGSCEITASKKIRDIATLRQCAPLIAADNDELSDIVILFFTLIRIEEPQEKPEEQQENQPK